jgi:glycerophosphoryl diester phosphodiesterase
MAQGEGLTMFTIAHRGLTSSGAQENSLAAFAAALEHVHVVEMDVRSTRDGVPVCVHDADLQRTHGLAGTVGRLDAAALRRDVPDVATLAEALDLLADREGAAMLDVKVSRPRAIEAIEQVVGDSRMHWNDGRQLRRGEPIDPGTVTFQSADSQLLQAFRSRTGAGCVELVRSTSSIRELALGAPFVTAYAQGVTIPDLLATRAMLRMLRGLRLGSYVYTINDVRRFEALTAAGASAIYTDEVDRIG